MDNTDNINPTSKNTKAKLFKLCFSGASGNNIYWLTSARKPLETKGFRALFSADQNRTDIRYQLACASN